MSGIFNTETLLTEITADRPYKEFLRVPAISAGMYVLPAGATDHQSPHNEDEIYYVVRGKAKMRLDSDVRPVHAGDVIFVEACLEHRFFDVEEKLVLLVVFAPAESG